MPRRKFNREFKIEAVRLVTERGVAVAQAARDLDPSDFGGGAHSATRSTRSVLATEPPPDLPEKPSPKLD